MESPVILKSFLEIPYDELEERNLEAKEKQLSRRSSQELQDHYLRYLQNEKRLKAVTVCFSDLEGRFHMLDYDKKFLLKSHDNLTFDGSSIRGFSVVNESDLRLEIDWPSFRWLPSDVFGPGKVIVFGVIKDRDGSSYASDMRAQLKTFVEDLHKSQGLIAQISVECEGFLFQGINAEQNYASRDGFKLVSSGGYYHSLPKDPLKVFIDSLAEAQRALGFQNEKDHPEVAPSQFELNYAYCDALVAADQVQLYKLTARQIAANMGLTASFLPKPIAGINGSGMHANISLAKDGKNIFFDKTGEEKLSKVGWDFVDRILNSANDLCVFLNSSVNAYRRLDPHFEAPNQIKSSPVDRTSMIRIPLGNEKSARIEVRTVAPDANPYLAFYLLVKTGLNGPMTEQITSETRRTRTRFLPDNIYDGIKFAKGSEFIKEILGEENVEKFCERKSASANRCPRELGTLVKTSEILFHHEVTNQYIWSRF
ncbi:MAG TPA: glutamine synthetase family protein [Oligoflexia bacterium]|nr:glutamine synthetase family protein [Oligoflexia bacterium]HMP26868.1 glutamine synthetase family protein [Oligoflexia bacterium]